MNIRKGTKYFVKGDSEWIEHTAKVYRANSSNSAWKRDDDIFWVYDINDDRRLVWPVRRDHIEKHRIEDE